MNTVRYIYANDSYDVNKEKVISNIISIACSLIELPNEIEVEFTKLDPSVYGETSTEFRFRNRITINEALSTKESIKPVIHELLHLNQIHTGRLSGRKGFVIWDGKIFSLDKKTTPEVWANLPWERDVAEKQQFLLEKILKLGVA